jgi:hypothetical protein
MKPSIAVMLGSKSKDGGEDSGEPGLSESKSAGLDAAKALISAVASKDADAVYRAFRSLSTLCGEVNDLEDSGESEEPPASEEADSDEE